MDLEVIPSRGPIRRALCVAVRYAHLEDLTLETTSYDPPKIRDLLLDVYGWQESEITILSDDPLDSFEHPTRENMLREMKNLVKDALPGDKFLFHFSGHGSQVENKDGKEKDGFDEVIFPCDVEVDPNDGLWRHSRNSILDDEIHDILVNPLPGGARLSIIFDSCHSGTAADLEHYYEDECTSPLSPISVPVDDINPSLAFRKRRLTVRGRGAGSPTVSPLTPSWENESRSEPYVVCWSACKDSQLTFESPGNTNTGGGLFIEAFTQALRQNSRPTHDGLLKLISYNITRVVRESIDRSYFASNKGPLRLPLNPQWSSNHSIAEYADVEVVF